MISSNDILNDYINSFKEAQNPDNPTIIIYTDGSCQGNPGPGGWGAVFLFDEKEESLCGHDPSTTNNRMELMAAIKALEALKSPCNVMLYTDSMYVRDGLTLWIKNWKKNGWMTYNKKPVKNQDLWQMLDKLQMIHKVKWFWVKGHNNDVYNEKANDLAKSAVLIQQFKTSQHFTTP